MSNVKLKRPTAGDLKSLKDFFTLIINDTYEKEGVGHLTHFIEEEIKKKMDYVSIDLNSHGADRFFQLAIQNNEIIGTVAIGPSGDDAIKCSNNEANGLLEIGSVFVHPTRQNMGIGKLMLESILNELKNRGIQKYCLDSGYSRAQKVWSHFLGSPKYIVDDYWDKGVPHMVWITEIKG